MLAADSQMTIGDVKLTSFDKIAIINEETIFACSGFDTSIQKAKRFFSLPNWEELMAQGKVPELKKDLDGCLVYKGVVYSIDRELTLDPIVHPYYSWGSGWQFAISAMELGYNAPDAVLFASKFDVNTNDKVRCLNVKEFFENNKNKPKRSARHSKRKTRMETEEEGSGSEADE